MAFLETVSYWNEGVLAFQENRFQDALLSFNQILDPSARIQFNLACVLQRLGKKSDCIVHLSEALKKDPHLAVAYYNRSVQLLKTQKYSEALDDLDRAEKSLRGATFINYSQLGLHFTLYKFEIQFNRAVCTAMKGDIRSAVHILIEAGKIAEEEVHNRISVKTIQDLTLVRQDGSKGSLPRSFKEFEIPDDCIFQPPKDMVANLGKKQYVAKAKVICRYGDGKTPKQQVITRSSKSISSLELEPKPSFSSLAPRTPPLPRRPLPPPPTEMRSSKSEGDIFREPKMEDMPLKNKIGMDNDLTKALNARFKNTDLNSNPSSRPAPQKPPNTPSRPPRRPPPPSKKTSSPALSVDSDAPPLPVKSSTMRVPSHTAPPPPKFTSPGTTRSIPPPPSYKPPPPPPSFKPPSPPIEDKLPQLPVKLRGHHA